MSSKKGSLQKRIRHYSPSNIFINYCNHCLALCLPNIMKDADFLELFGKHSIIYPKRNTFRVSGDDLWKETIKNY